MSVAAAIVMTLVCAGKSSVAAKAGDDMVGRVRLPLTQPLLEQLKAEPPLARLRFVGEAETQREWIINGAQDPATGTMQLIRLSRSRDLLSPFFFRAGRVKAQSAEPLAFEELVQGNCFFSPANTPSEGTAQ